ncbi:MAG TPA: hypothetical protein DCL42_11405 [Deltaproteobacteria bacterium]|nr:hypothetical protein [Deltaproteobacteria bacterium]
MHIIIYHYQMKCEKCKGQLEDGDLVAVRLALRGTGKKKTFKTVEPIQFVHNTPNEIRILRYNAGENLPLDCMIQSYGFFAQGVFYQGKIYPTDSLQETNRRLSIGPNLHSNGLRVRGDLTYLVDKQPLY